MNFMMVDPAIEAYALQHSTSESPLLKELVAETYCKMSAPHMISGPIVGNLLKWLVSLSGAERILEIGMFTGYSALYMTEGLKPNGRIITCDVDPTAEEIARKYFAMSEHKNKIEIMMKPALEVIDFLKKQVKTNELLNLNFNILPLDFVFIDADKENYFNYFTAVSPLLKSGGLIVFDNALRGGQVLQPTKPGSKAIDQVNKAIVGHPDFENILLTIRDGVNILRKK